VQAGETVGLSAGASAPENLMDEVVAEFRNRFDVDFEEIAITKETVEFNVPRALA
jgi:4-hydroxy-3-methylbut-2-enyl diphosphate reductase